MSELLIPSRRGFLAGLGTGLICAPAIVRASSLMSVKALPEAEFVEIEERFVITGQSQGVMTLARWAEEVLNPKMDALRTDLFLHVQDRAFNIGDVITIR